MFAPYVLIMCTGVYEDQCREVYSAFGDAVNDNRRLRNVAPPQGACPEDDEQQAKPAPAKPL